MAIKPITNKHAVNKESINRGKQVSTRNQVVRGGNRSQTIVPGKDFTKNYAITLKNIDTSIISYMKDVIRPSVREAGERIKVPIMYGNEERWVNARKRGVIKDKNGSLILPLVMLKRTNVERNTEMPVGMEHNVMRTEGQVVRSSTWSKDNRYDRFSVQTGKKPVQELITTTMPNFVNVTYEVILWTAYVEQMNYLIESFVEQSRTYWGNSTDLEK